MPTLLKHVTIARNPEGFFTGVKCGRLYEDDQDNVCFHERICAMNFIVHSLYFCQNLTKKRE